MSIEILDLITPNILKHFTIKGRIRGTLIILIACRVAIAAPTSYSNPIRLIPLIPPGAAPRIVVITSILSNLLIHNPIANSVITKVKVNKIAGLHKVWRSINESLVNYVPVTVPMLISKIVLVPIGHSAILTLPLMLSMLALIKAPAIGAAEILVFRAKPQKCRLQEGNIWDLCLALILVMFGYELEKNLFA